MASDSIPLRSLPKTLPRVHLPMAPRSSRGFPFPGVLPAGWYALGLAADFPRGTVRALRRFGRELVAFRTERGTVGVLAAHCPHMGAHLGGGTVDGECLRCPFHDFGYDVDGRCVSLGEGYHECVPTNLSSESWPVRTVGGIVLTWFHPGGAPPEWEVPDAEESGWRAPLSRAWQLRTHPQETGEGSVDVGHLRAVHRYVDAEHTARPLVDRHMLKAAYRVRRSMPVPFLGDTFDLDVSLTLHGLGYSLADVRIPEFGLRFRLWVLSTPIDGENVEYRIVMRLQEPLREHVRSATLRALLGHALERAIFPFLVRDVEYDFPIWESKVYLESPRLVRGDGPIHRYRKWATQFYVSSLELHK